MRYHALACDYDGTIATNGTVDAPTLEALERLRASGRKLILVTGRVLEDLLRVFHRMDLFDAMVLENGAVLYWHATEEQERLADAPRPALAKLLRQRGVEPLSEGRVILATYDNHRDTVLGAIEELGLELQIIFNKGSIMVLPAGVNKATGLQAALDRIGMSSHNVVGVGDAENDHAFITACECGVAVKNALGSLMEKADFVTHGAAGGGIIELVDAILEDELAGIDPKLNYKGIDIGERGIVPFGADEQLSPAESETVVQHFLSAGYQFLIVDPNGSDSAPAVSDLDEALRILAKPRQSATVTSIPIDWSPVISFYERTGRPHWLVVPHTVQPPEGTYGSIIRVRQ